MSPTKRPERVLIFSPYARWNVHSLVEICAYHGLRQRQADPLYVACDGIFKDCDIYWHATCGDRAFNACLGCRTAVDQMLRQHQVEFRWISQYLIDQDLADAAAYAASLSPDNVAAASFDGLVMFDWVRSSVHTHFRVNRIDLTEPRHFHAVRNYLEGAALTLRAVRRIVHTEQPTRAFLFNGRVAYARVALEVFHQAHIPTICHERGLINESIGLWEQANCSSLAPFRQIAEKWNSHPLGPDEIKATVGWLADRRGGKNMNWNPFSRRGGLRSVRPFLAAHPNKRIVTLFTSSTDEVVAEPDFVSVFGTQESWIRQTIDLIAQRHDCVLIIRAHPNSGSRVSIGRNVDELAFCASLKDHLPANVKLLLPDDPESSYALMDISHVGLVYASTVAIELACLGKPVFAACTSAGTYCASVLHADDRAAYPRLLDELITHTQTPEERREVMRAGLRFARGYQLWNLDFPIVRHPNFYQGSLAVPLDSLRPGRHVCLDNCVDTILGIRAATPGPATRDAPDAVREGEALQELLCDEESSRVAYMVPRVSIAVVARDEHRLVTETLSNIVNQSFAEWELLLIDTAGTASSSSAIRTLVAPNEHDRIRLMPMAAGTPPAQARNQALRTARGDYFLVLDPGDTLAPEALAECVAALDANSAVDIVYPSRLRMLEDGSIRVENPPQFTIDSLLKDDGIGHDALYRRRVWQDIQGYRDNVGICLDWDFWLAALERGLRAAHLPKPLFIHRGTTRPDLAALAWAREWGCARLILNNPGSFLPEARAQAAHLLEGRSRLAAFTTAERAGDLTSWPPDRLREVVDTAVELNDPGLCRRACHRLLALDPGNERALAILCPPSARLGRAPQHPPASPPVPTHDPPHPPI